MRRKMPLEHFLMDRKGTAEVIGTIMLVMILLFFFTNVYVFHDLAVRQSNDLSVKKINAGMEIDYVMDENNLVTGITVTAKGSEVILSRLWIDHVYANLESRNIQLKPGDANAVTFTFDTGAANSDCRGGWFVTFDPQDSNNIIVHYSLPTDPKFVVVNTLGVIISG
jgi:hypothetical protein